MTKSELAIVVILRLMGALAVLAIPAIFFPFSWMDAIHRCVGLGNLPDAPIVDYLARSLSAFYAIVGIFTLFISFDIRRYRSLVTLWAVIVAIMGGVLLGIVGALLALPVAATLQAFASTMIAHHDLVDELGDSASTSVASDADTDAADAPGN